MAAIGIEIEILLSLRDEESDIDGTADLETFTEWLVGKFNSSTRGEFAMHSDIDGEYDGEEEGTEWSITDDATLEHSRTSNQWAVEFVSPILQYGDLSWRAELQAMFESIEDYCSFTNNRSCGTHVHISPGVGLMWSIGDLKKIACAILHFEKAWNVIIPVARRCNKYAKSNRFDNPKLAMKTDAQCIEAVNACENSVTIADLMNNDGDRYFSWNFTNLYCGRKMTVEFRRGPGVQDFGTCEAWVVLAVAFIQAARRAETVMNVIGFSANVEGLRAFIHEGFDKIGEQIEGMDGLFDGKTGAIQTSPIGQLSATELEKLRQKKANDDKKNFMVRKIQKTS